MTQPLLFAQTGPSTTGASPFGSAATLGTRWRIGGEGDSAGAGVAESKANTAGKSADFAHTLREKKQASRSDQAAKSKPEKERSAHAEEAKTRTRKAKRTDEKPDVESEQTRDSTTSEPTNQSPKTDENVRPEAKVEPRENVSAKDVQPDAQAAPQADPNTVKPVDVATQPVDTTTPVEKVVPTATPEPSTQPTDAANADQPKVAVQAVAPSVAPVAQTVQQSQPQVQTDKQASAKDDAAQGSEKAPASVAQAKPVDAESRTANQPTNIAALDHAFRTNAAATQRPGGQAARPEAASAGRPKVAAATKPVAEAVSEGVKPASESAPEAKAAAHPADAAEQALPPSLSEAAAPTPVREAAQIQDLGAQAARAETSSVSSLPIVEKAQAPDAGAAAAMAAEGRIEPTASVQSSPSADMLRALSSSHSSSNINAAPPAANANNAAASPEFQRAMGQQVERGIALAIQQASAANNAMAAGTGSVVLRLHPAHLGQLKVQIKFESGTGGVRARFEASSSKAKSLLGDSIGSLRTALEDRGLRVDEMVVAQSPRLPEPDLGMYPPGMGQDARTGAEDIGPGFADQHGQPAPSFGALASGASRTSAAETDSVTPIGSLGGHPVMLTGAAGWTVDADGNVRVDALV